MEIKDRQLEIIEAAGELLTESGLGGLTTKNLAAKMGFSEAALYKHFKNKEDIVLTMLRYLAGNIEERMVNTVSKYDKPQDKLSAIFKSQFTFFDEKPQFLIAIFSEGLLESSPEINQAISDIMAITRKHLIQIIQQGQKQGQFTHKVQAADLAHIVMGSFRLQMLQWRMSGFGFDLKARGNKLIANLIALIATRNSIL
ncbi:MAG TPA: TetR/AcrR family transcriptional regulator [Cytophagales bacterium]|nr:TetR/AcrR family transcriptional regulator [Cytophagales bacterium]